MIKRNIENIILDTITHYPATLISGPRQIGKSTLLYNSVKPKGYAYISLDDTLELALAKSDPKTFLEVHKPPLIIDEAQKAPQLFSELEKIINKSRLENGNKASNGMYILSGSQRQKLLDEAKESLAGKVAILDMSDLSLSEIFKRDNTPFFVDVNKNSLRAKDYILNEENVFKYITRGFFPALYDDPTMGSQLFYSSYLTTYIEKDLKDFISVTDDVKFINFMKILASNTGQELIYDNYSNQVGVVTNTIKAWVSVLIKTGIIYLVEPYNEESIVKRVVKRPKMYFFDTGFAAYLCGIDTAETLQRSFLKGRFFETFVFNEIRKSYINNGEIREFYYYRDNDQNEIDFVLLRNGTLSCIEIKSGQTFNASYTKGFKKLSDTKYIKGQNAIICTADKISILNDGTYVLPVSCI